MTRGTCRHESPSEAVDLVEDAITRGPAVDVARPAGHRLDHVLHQQGPVAYQRLYHDEAAPDQLQVTPPGLQHRLVLAPSPDLSLLLADDPFEALDCLLHVISVNQVHSRSDSKKVDYILALDAGDGTTLNQALRFFVHNEGVQRGPLPHINQTIYRPLQWSPI
ncbi:hypothetical protein JX266_014255, partial [Neoarthrinium moseri]